MTSGAGVGNMCDRLDVERFILEVKCRPAIWDMSSKLYADDRDSKKNTWMELV